MLVNIVTLKMIETKNHLIRYLDKVIIPLALILHKINAYFKTLKLEIEIKVMTINRCLSV